LELNRAAGGWRDKRAVWITQHDIADEETIAYHQIHRGRCDGICPLAVNVNSTTNITGLIVFEPRVIDVNDGSVAMQGAPCGKLRVTWQIHAISYELGITDVDPGSVGAEATGEVLRGIIEPCAGLK